MDSLVVERPHEGVLALWLNRPEKRNALDGALVGALIDALDGVTEAVVVLGSRDPRCFCAGADLSIPDADRAGVSDRLYELYRRMVLLPAPIVAAVDGPAVGGGAQLALAADLRVAGPSARLRFPGPGHGLAVGAWGLPSLVGRGRALDLCLTMREVGAEEAIEIGLVDRIADDAAAAALELAAAIAKLDQPAVARVKDVARIASGALEALERERAENRAAWSGSVEGLRRS
jgi:enoyl-CoA hydratase